jgi:hypothetical protein
LTPKVTISPVLAASTATSAASRNSSGSAMWWSAASISITPSGDTDSHIGRRGGDGRRGIARLGLDDHRQLDAQLQRLAFDQLGHGLAGDHHDLVGARQVDDPQDRFLEAGTVADQLQELLGTVRARRGPKTGA